MMQLTTDRPVIDRDTDLLEALRRRDATAAECLVSAFGDRAYRLAVGITGNQPDAEEAVQDAFWNVIHKIDTFRGDTALGSWIYRITANAAYQKRHSARRRRDEISLDDILPTSTRMVAMRIRSSTGQQRSTTRRYRPSFGAFWLRRSRSCRTPTVP